MITEKQYAELERMWRELNIENKRLNLRLAELEKLYLREKENTEAHRFQNAVGGATGIVKAEHCGAYTRYVGVPQKS